jgi:hypothetical protein
VDAGPPSALHRRLGHPQLPTASDLCRSLGIIVNVAGSFTSAELMPGFYKYGYGFAFFNSVSEVDQRSASCSNFTSEYISLQAFVIEANITDSSDQIQGARTIMCGTKNNFGILIAWMLAGLIGGSVFTAWTLKQNQKKKTAACPSIATWLVQSGVRDFRIVHEIVCKL